MLHLSLKYRTYPHLRLGSIGLGLLWNGLFVVPY